MLLYPLPCLPPGNSCKARSHTQAWTLMGDACSTLCVPAAISAIAAQAALAARCV